MRRRLGTAVLGLAVADVHDANSHFRGRVGLERDLAGKMHVTCQSLDDLGGSSAAFEVVVTSASGLTLAVVSGDGQSGPSGAPFRMSRSVPYALLTTRSRLGLAGTLIS